MTVTEATASAFLGLSASDPRQGQLAGVLQAALDYVAGRVGTRGATSTYTVHPDGKALILPFAPVSSVSAVTDPFGTSVDLSTAAVDLRAGVVTLASATKDGPRTAYTVTMTLPASAMADEATLIIVKHLWETRRGREGREQVFASPEDDVPVGFAIPRRAAQLLAAVETPLVA